MLSFEVVSVLVRILLLHYLETRNIEIGQMFSVIACGPIKFCHFDCGTTRITGQEDDERPSLSKHRTTLCRMRSSFDLGLFAMPAIDFWKRIWRSPLSPPLSPLTSRSPQLRTLRAITLSAVRLRWHFVSPR